MAKHINNTIDLIDNVIDTQIDVIDTTIEQEIEVLTGFEMCNIEPIVTGYESCVLISNTQKIKSTRDYTPTKESIRLIEKYGNKSKAIRALYKEGHSTSRIADMLNIRYQHVRNTIMMKTKD